MVGNNELFNKEELLNDTLYLMVKRRDITLKRLYEILSSEDWKMETIMEWATQEELRKKELEKHNNQSEIKP